MAEVRPPKIFTVMIKCPNTGKEISTGMATSKIAFEKTTYTDNIIICPACGKKHVWSKKDAFLK